MTNITNNKPKAIIYRPAKSAMTSGRGKTESWLLEYKPSSKHPTDDLIGWIGNDDVNRKVKLKFSSRGEAINYAEKHAIKYEVQDPKERKMIIKSYADNFTS